MDFIMFFGDVSDIPDNATIRHASLSVLARHFQGLREANIIPWQKISSYINTRINSEALPPTVAQVFLTTYDNEHVIATALRQGVSASIRRVAMDCFKKKCRSSEFSHMWAAIGRIPGLIALMSTMSVRDVNRLCRCIGECTSKKPTAGRREKVFTDLLKALRNTDGSIPLVPKNPDTRPLDFCYNKILPACEPHVIFDEITKIEKIRKMTDCATIKGYVDNFNDAIFPENGIGKKMTPYKFVLDGNDVQFSLNILMRLSFNHDSLKINADNLIQDLARPLARRLHNRREGDYLQEPFFDSLIDCIRKEPSIANGLDHSMISYAIKAWDRAYGRRECIKQHLATLVQLATNDHQWTLGEIANELQHVKPSLRAQLFRLLLGNARPFRVAIDTSFGADREALRSLGKAWPPKLFYLLPSRISLRLFKVLSSIHPNGKFIAKDRGAEKGMEYVNHDHMQYGDSDMLFALLRSRRHYNNPYNMTLPVETHNILQQRKYKAMSIRNEEEMASWIQSIIRLSIASGSLFLYEDTVLWARQFDGNPVVAKMLLSSSTLLSQEGLDILSGISRPLLKHYSSLHQLQENVERANRVLMQHVEMLSSRYESASILLQNMFNVFLLPAYVIQRRMERLRAFKARTRLSDDEIYESVWEPSISMLLDTERLLLKIGDKYSFLNKIRGPLRHLSLPNKPELHIRRFLDVLGESRDKLWQEYRAEINPIVEGLDVPWPKGLPIQALVSHKLSNWKDMPYIELRAGGVLFAPGRTLISPIPMQSEERAAIGPFVDDFIFALQVFVSAVDEGPERESRVLQAWDHAVANFSSEQMSKKQALWYWKHIFSLAPNVKLPHPIASLFKVSYLQFPEHNRSTVFKWNPNQELVQLLPTPTIIQPPEKLPGSCLECMLMVHKTGSSKTVYSPFQFCDAETIQTMSTSSIWDVWSSRGTIPSEGTDCAIAITVAFLNVVYGSNFSLFERPFPSKDDIRFPAFRLDEKFLEDESNLGKLSSILRILEHLSPCIPGTLFQGLARSIWKRLHAEEKEDPEILKAAIGVVKIILRGDHPDAAHEFIIKGILKPQENNL
ncbi:uncharacterized protein GGS22DRAFT_197955 [Annulohypoxylon maeteangense]|uniref:uncharacterized protein n=1 Tax=Annulohypoxylon maeteangense TaxID=1927788 RepID=UPI0020081932|nr:uncharacterized protein GGS22DRAFT_197955 [Annulohypoxylon maeteangense]KAI0888094.1 hypothetical protein GGS22DRAFT_197955 [Annulohypoxylon maeteangense]